MNDASSFQSSSCSEATIRNEMVVLSKKINHLSNLLAGYGGSCCICKSTEKAEKEFFKFSHKDFEDKPVFCKKHRVSWGWFCRNNLNFSKTDNGNYMDLMFSFFLAKELLKESQKIN